MHFYTYIIQSRTSGRLYIGQTSILERRLTEHNEGITPSTRGKGPWQLLFAKEFSNRSEAVRLERQLKSWKNPKKILIWTENQK